MKNFSGFRSEPKGLVSGDSTIRRGCLRSRWLVIIGFLLLVIMTPAAVTADDGGPSGSVKNATSGTTEVAFKPSARVCYDLASYNENKNRLTNGSILRYGRLGGRLQVERCWTASLDISFDYGKPAVADVWGEYRYRGFVFRGGNFKEPLGMEVSGSVFTMPFMERSLSFALSPFRKIGASISRSSSLYTLSVGVFNGNLVHGDGEPGMAVTGRATMAPRLDDDSRIHLGIGLSRRTADADTGGVRSVSFEAFPETRVDDTKFLNTGKINDADYLLTVEIEAAMRWRWARLCGEYWDTEVRRSAGLAEPGFEGGYVAADIVLCGRPREYQESSAVFGGITPSGANRALEVALRYSWLDLNDTGASISGGKAQEYTLAVNWQLNPHLRWMMNYGIVENDAAADGAGTLHGDDDYTFVQSRLQMSY